MPSRAVSFGYNARMCLPAQLGCAEWGVYQHDSVIPSRFEATRSQGFVTIRMLPIY
jgi:hypothetical protein